MIPFCRDLLGIYCVGPNQHEIDDESSICAFSFNKQTLEKMIESIEDRRNNYVIAPVKLYSLTMNNLQFNLEDNTPYSSISLPIYGYYYEDNNTYEMVLLSTDVVVDNSDTYVKQNDISFRPVYIDTFYEESIINA